jgi:hypothetical protein
VSLQIIRKEGALRAARTAALNPSNPADVSNSPATQTKPTKSPAKDTLTGGAGTSKRAEKGGANCGADAPPQKTEDKKPAPKVVRAVPKPYVNFFEK